MGDLFKMLQHQVETNAGHAVEAYAREVSEYKSAMADQRAEASMLDFAVFIRRRSLERASAGRPLSEDDLAVIASTGQQRGEQMLSLRSQQRVLDLHTTMMLKEIQDGAAAGDSDNLLRIVGWFGQQGMRARAAYLQGYLMGVGHSRSVADEVGLLARMLLLDEPIEPAAAGRLGMQFASHYLVCVVRIPPPEPSPELRAEVVEVLLRQCRTPMIWLEPNEFVMLAPVDEGAALGLVREVAAAVARPCSVGSATGPRGALADPLASARQVSRVVPRELQPRRLWADLEVFVELGVSRQPRIDAWLQGLVARLASGPSLLSTLDAYYQNDMNRAGTAIALRVHPRTLDYRLQRVRELTGLDAGSTQGVRVLSAAVMRALAS